MNRREALIALAGAPIAAFASPLALAKQPMFVVHELAFRRSAGDPKNIFDEKEPIDVGTTYEAFGEQWEHASSDFTHIRRLAQKHRGRYRVVGPDEKATFIFRDYDGDPLTVRLAAVERADCAGGRDRA